ncbi:hypothetical protein BGZ96_000261 [Linnemannia gamsii]|uniref:C2H2-type domain-containing protein n=1 Tax=Linnemannia gamsii TaxID=64522 RepID=A0ABQ7JPC8_9FUNG|nr:hypothetical protein BGZ96_000261 [Linnemannia gamsii]
MQVHPTTPNHYYTTSTTQQQQHPYNPNMFASTSSPQYTLLEQQQQQQQQQPNEDMFVALERLLMGISPFPPTMPTLAKPTCPSLDDQLMAEMSSPSPSTIPSIVLNEQSLDMLQQFYQNQDSQHNHNNQYTQSHDQSDCSSTSRSGSPPASPYSYASSLVSSPAMPILDYNNHYASMVAQQQQHHHHQQQHDYCQQQFEQMSMPLNLPPIEAYMAPSAALLSHSHSHHCQHAQPLSSAMPTTTYKKSKTHHRRSSSSASSGISAYETTASRGYRASSISSVCSATSNTSTIDASTLTKTSRPVKSYACPTCTKPFPTRTQLKSHMAIHTDLFPFPCQYAGCELHFKRKHDLRRHMVRHLRRGTCGKGFQTE